MADRDPQPGMTAHAEAERQARLEREAAALRANLRRRKDQVRSRAGAETADAPVMAPDVMSPEADR